jgi:glucosamine--fructose-6-phosphate aminotransferase (isomerizing)
MTEDRVAQFHADIQASPAALATLLAEPHAARIPAEGRTCLTGLGSSRYAADIVAGSWRAEGRTAWTELASGEWRTRPAADLTLVAISASGGTPEVVDAARRHRGTSHVIAVTNRADSALAAAADEVVLLHGGVEASGIACRTFRATLAALHRLGGGSVEALQPLPEAIAQRLPQSTAWAAGVADMIDGAPAIDVLADAALGGLAEQAALMLREGPRLPAHAGETADWLHVGVYLAWPGHVVVRYPGSAADAELERTLRGRGVRLVDVPVTLGEAGGVGGDPIARAIVTSIDAEVLAQRLWTRATAQPSGDKGP